MRSAVVLSREVATICERNLLQLLLCTDFLGCLAETRPRFGRNQLALLPALSWLFCPRASAATSNAINECFLRSHCRDDFHAQSRRILCFFECASNKRCQGPSNAVSHAASSLKHMNIPYFVTLASSRVRYNVGVSSFLEAQRVGRVQQQHIYIDASIDTVGATVVDQWDKIISKDTGRSAVILAASFLTQLTAYQVDPSKPCKSWLTIVMPSLWRSCSVCATRQNLLRLGTVSVRLQTGMFRYRATSRPSGKLI
ncbi:hypothetical protein MRB53_039193 [Persea americana]|nr:hypothetical protein MRB53_039193 [Persea americana]